jgi:hypothetical protein
MPAALVRVNAATVDGVFHIAHKQGWVIGWVKHHLNWVFRDFIYYV